MTPFNKIYISGNELHYIEDAISTGHLAGDGKYTNYCKEWLEDNTNALSALLTNSCTSALEMSASLLNIGHGDEVIMPSFTFVSTANAFVSRGATPVFVDIRKDTLNIDEALVEEAISPNTKAIVVVHYAGVSCDMKRICDIASSYKIPVIEDAAQGIMAKYKGSALGSIGDLGCISFHDTKNIVAGEGGALLINNPMLIDRAEIIRDKGTNRKIFLRGEIDKYTWVDEGSSYLPSELISAFLFAQLEKAREITEMRLQIWNQYHAAFRVLEKIGKVIRPTLPSDIQHNGHIYFLILKNSEARDQFINSMKAKGIVCTFHYIPLHNSDAGTKWGKMKGKLQVTEDIASRIVRLPIWPMIDSKKVIDATIECIS
jgi:dTDP-4-amino-4,6-dideoxygalactose transaminase